MEEDHANAVEIDFQGMSGTPEVHASIEKHVAELEQRYGRVTACRVVLKGPGGHHRTGGLYEVIPSPIDQNRCAHWRNPMDMMRQG